MHRNFSGLSKKETGDEAEGFARRYLEAQGLDFVTSNFHSRMGEIDLIMYDAQRETLVFVEVRYRRNRDYGGAALSVTHKKQQRLIKTALFYLQRHAPNANARFDVLAIDGGERGNDDTAVDDGINWIVDAFQATY